MFQALPMNVSTENEHDNVVNMSRLCLFTKFKSTHCEPCCQEWSLARGILDLLTWLAAPADSSGSTGLAVGPHVEQIVLCP
jgi:hypothetical protein